MKFVQRRTQPGDESQELISIDEITSPTKPHKQFLPNAETDDLTTKKTRSWCVICGGVLLMIISVYVWVNHSEHMSAFFVVVDDDARTSETRASGLGHSPLRAPISALPPDFVSASESSSEIENEDEDTDDAMAHAQDVALEIDEDEDESIDLTGKGKSSAGILSVKSVTKSTKPLRVAVYIGPGASVNSKKNAQLVFECTEQFNVTALQSTQIKLLTNDNFDVVLFPGGSAGRTLNTMAKRDSKTPQIIRAFVRNGGGYLGICAGAFMSRALGLSPFNSHGAILGGGYITSVEFDRNFKTEPYNLAIQPIELPKNRLFYMNGPIFANVTNSLKKWQHSPQAIVRIQHTAMLHTFAKKKVHTTDYNGDPVIVFNGYGEGRVVLSTGHPESDLSLLPVEPWAKPHEASTCDTVAARLLQSLVLIAGNRQRWGS